MTDAKSTITPPVHGGQLRQISQHFGLAATKLLDFSANLHPTGPPACALEAVRAATLQPSILRDYPDMELPDLRSALADYSGVEPDNVFVANGMAPLLDAVLRALRLRSCLVPVPAFSEYAKTLANCDVALHRVVLSSQQHFLIRPDAILAELDRRGCDALLLANPQNPSGVLLPADEMLTLVSGAQERGVRVLLDEAFIDYAPLESVTARAPDISDLIVFRSVTKFFSLAGLRIAYAVAAEDVCNQVKPFVASWPVSTLAAVAACSALQDTEYRQKAILENEAAREVLRSDLAALGLEVYPGRANYLLFRMPEVWEGANFWEELIVRHHIVVRNCENYQGLDSRFFRAAVRTPDDNARFIAALAAAMKGNGSAP